MERLCQTKCDPNLAFERAPNEFFLLLLVAEVLQHDHLWEVSNNAVLVLEVIEQSQSFARKMLSDDGHPQIAPPAIGAVHLLAAILLWKVKAPKACLVGSSFALYQQFLPLFSGQASILEVCSRPFAPVVEEAIVVVLFLQWNYLLLNESIEIFKELD
jgi:hypothetical protein